MNFTLTLKKVEGQGHGIMEDGSIKPSFLTHYTDKDDIFDLKVKFSVEDVLIPKSVNVQFKDFQKTLGGFNGEKD